MLTVAIQVSTPRVTGSWYGSLRSVFQPRLKPSLQANDFWDPAENEHFSYHKDATNWQPQWWLGEPVICFPQTRYVLLANNDTQMWATVVKNGGRSAVSMWPGPPRLLDGTKPSYYVPWQPEMTWEQKADQVEYAYTYDITNARM